MNNVARDPEAAVKQECTVRSLYFSGATGAIAYVVGSVFLVYKADWVALSLWLILLPCLKWAYLRFFFRISKWKGYGSVADKLPASV